ncbi:BTAD domain-containing putative transcriptional regulator [Wenjunlia tyrosinilytica]|uniref:OmpR/PhoB-type domain-containing protein n=1 Tax=Wenjunlia tyrosinilytica TaxID=1544741 RepID=A0A918A0I1_9ACTN|nr:BTAD domain-containing putative transcriptional regulator [Wenjunlia tyrosinilytica]GGP00032.1 hypothetical protein GCM10012280_67850 [Wenjunlia tyrosinilytica]
MEDREHEPRQVRFSVLGPLSAEIDGRALSLGPLKQRLVLATLLCRPNAPVPIDVLMDSVWPENPPRTARKNLQVYVSTLRKLLCDGSGRDRIPHQAGGYVLRVAPPELDTFRFQALARSGRDDAAGGAPASAARLLRQALDLWRGEAYPGLDCSELIRSEAERLERQYLGVFEDWAEAEVLLGSAPLVAEAIGEIAERHPLRERLRAAQMTALHQVGRQAEALAVYDGLRQVLARELGLAPSAALEGLYKTILTGGRSGTRHKPRPPGADRIITTRTVLPPDIADFTGRQEQVRELLEVVGTGRGRVALAVGPVGVGKTTLVTHVAHRLRDEFPDGRFMVKLRHEDGSSRPRSAVLAELARLTGLAGRMPEDADQATAVWRSWLAERKVLLVLDDAPDEGSVRQLLPGAGAGAALVTSRAHLAGLASAQRVEVPPFSAGQAVDLLGRIIGPDRIHSDLPAAQQIVAASGLLPLGIRVSGLKLAVLRHLPLHEYATRLADPLTVLDELAVGDIALLPRLADGWQDMPEPRRTALIRLARLPVSRLFTLHEGAAALGCGTAQALRELESLIDTGAVGSPVTETTSDAALYTIPRLTHLYARRMSPAGTPC